MLDNDKTHLPIRIHTSKAATACPASLASNLSHFFLSAVGEIACICVGGGGVGGGGRGGRGGGPIDVFNSIGIA